MGAISLNTNKIYHSKFLGWPAGFIKPFEAGLVDFLYCLDGWFLAGLGKIN